MLGADVVVAELARLLDRELQHALGLRRERDLAEREGLGESGQGPLDLALDGLEPKPQALQDRGCDPLPVANQSEQDVLGPHEVVAEPAGLLSGEDDDASRALGESLEHVVSSRPGVLAPGSQAKRPVFWDRNGRARQLPASLYMRREGGAELLDHPTRYLGAGRPA